MKTSLLSSAQRITGLVFMLSMFFAMNASAQLNGLSYTINPGSAASASNYQSILAAVNDLSGVTRGDGGPAQGPGISGPVKITVTAGTYTYSSTLIINAITGAGGHSGADSIIFDGGSAATSTLTQSATSGNNTTLWLMNSSYITIKNFTITGGSTLVAANSGFNFWGVAIVGNPGTVSHDDVINCTVTMATQAAAATTGPGAPAQIGIVVDGETATNNNSANVSGFFTNIYLTGNTINNGHHGIYAFGSGATPSGVNIMGNTITGFSTFGLDMFNIICPKIKNNIINGSIASNLAEAVAMNTAYNPSSTTDWVEISGNYITSQGRYGILLNGAGGNSSQPTRIFNNMVYSTTTLTAARAISYLNSNNGYINIWNNTIVMNTASTATSGSLSVTAATNNADIRNNIFAFIGSGGAYPLFITTSSWVTNCDYNVFYNSSATPTLEANINGTSYTNSTVVGGGGFNSHSAVANPNFISNTNLHITALPSGCPKGDASVLTSSPMAVTTDYDGQTRGNPPTIGADELTVSSSPATATVCTGANQLLTATPGATWTPSSYLWNPGAATGTTYNPAVAATTTYTVSAIDANGCTAAQGTSVITANSCGFNIVSSAGANGSISPNGTTSVSPGANQTYTFTPSACYSVATVTVDGSTVTPAGSYTFTSVSATHTIAVTFSLDAYNITASAGANGSISPSGVTSVNCGSNQAYTITPNSGYSVQDVLVDGVSQGAITTYTFTSVSATHTISATFSINTFTITTSAGANGTVTPPNPSVNSGSNQTIAITPNACYSVVGLTVDGSTVTPATSYTFTNVTANHTISATFGINTYVITSSPGANGTISPSSPSVNCGSNQTFTITPSTCYQVATVTVDGSTVTPAGSYTFNNVQATHTIAATFSYTPVNISVSPSPATICLSGSVLTASGAGGSGTYKWSPSSGLSATTGATVTASQSGTVTYTILGTTSIGCTGSNTVVATPAVAMSGTYTINPSATGGQLYSNGGRSFVDFPTTIAALTCAGISAPVTVNVTAGTYTGAITIPAITGAGGHSGSDSIIFDGGSAATTTLTQATSTGNNVGFWMLNSSYITVKNFTITAAFASANSTANFWGVGIVGNPGTVTHDDVINCTITMATQSAVASVIPLSPAWIGVVVDGENANNVSANVSGFFSNIYITGNTVTNGHHGIYAFGSNALPAGVNIIGNTVTGFSTFGLDMFNIIAPKIRNNVINGCIIANGAEAIAINTASNGGSTTDWTEISGNFITSQGRYGVLLNGGAGSASQPTRIFNNMVYVSTTLLAARGISTLNSTFSPGNSYINYWNNSIVLNTPSTSTSGALTLDNGAANSDIRNNILAYIGTSTGLPVVIPTIANVTAFDYNMFYNSSPTPNNEGSIGGTTYTNATILNNNYGGATTFNIHSVVADPHFVNVTSGSQNLHITQQCNRGDAFVLTSSPMSVTSDYDGQSRPWPGETQPNIGADEIIGNTPAISVTAPSGPTAICSGNSVALGSSCSVNCTSITYTWSPATGLSATTGASVTAGPTLAATYTYTVTGTNNFGCTATSTTPAITVNPLPVFTVSPPSGNICNGDVLGLTASGTSTYSWQPSGSLSSGTGASVNAAPSTSTTYTVTGATALGCTATVTDIVTVKPTPPVDVTPNNAVCTGGTTATLVASGAVSYTWSPTTNLTPTNGTAATETAQISALTIYTVVGTGSNGCTASDVVPVATVAVGGTISPIYSIICSGGTKLLTVSGAAGHDYQWQISGDNSSWTPITGATNTTYTTNTTDGNTNKYYRLLAQSNSCWNVASTTAEVDVSQPIIPITASGLTDNSVNLNWLPIGQGNYNISYTGTSSGTVLGTTPPKIVTGLTANGSYTITLNQTGTGLGGCPASGTVNINTLCPAPPTVTVISTGTTSITLSWSGGAGNYRVYYRPLYAYNGYFTRDVINGTSTTLTTQGGTQLYHSVTYEVYVTRLDCPSAGNIGQASAKIYATTTPALTCAAPVIDSVRSLCPVQIEVWVHGSPTNQYYIDVERLTPTVQPVTSYPVTGSYFTMNVSAGQNYLISARSICGGGVSNLAIWPGTLQIKPQCTAVANLLLSNPTCSGFTASWNADQCIANNASYYQLFIRQVGTINWNGYGVTIPTFPIGPYKLVNWLGKGKTFDVFAKAVYSCNGYLTYGATTQTLRITTLSAGCREEATEDPTTQAITQQTSLDNSEVFSLYPNPNNGQFTVDLSRLNTNEDAVRIEVSNMLGQTILTHLTSISDGHLTEFINLPASTTAGTYVVRLTAGKNVYTGKINISK